MVSYMDMIQRDYPKLFIDDPVATESRGLVFPMDGPRARDLGARLLDEVGGSEEL